MIPGDQKKKNTAKIEKYVNCLSDRKIFSGECHSFFFLSFTTVRGTSSLNLSFVLFNRKHRRIYQSLGK